jgi:3-oxoacyl-(acyl-carrier-protein) synthase
VPTPISIVSLSSLSPLGHTPERIWDNYLNGRSCIRPLSVGGKSVPAAALGETEAGLVTALRESDPRYKHLDNSVLYAIIASRNAVQNAGWGKDADFGINIGSSRGATELFEKYHTEFLQTGTTGIQSSPATTLGNISSWVAQDLKNNGTALPGYGRAWPISFSWGAVRRR